MRRLLIAIAMAVMFGGGLLAPASANNDPLVPADECSGNPIAIGQPGVFGSTNATDIVDILRGEPNPVDGPASLNNPGQSTGAQGQDHFNGGQGCTAGDS